MLSKEKAAEAFREGRSVMLDDGRIITRPEDLPEEMRPTSEMLRPENTGEGPEPAVIPSSPVNTDNSRPLEKEEDREALSAKAPAPTQAITAGVDPNIPSTLNVGTQTTTETETTEEEYRVVKAIPDSNIEVGATLKKSAFSSDESIQKLVNGGYIEKV